MKRRVISSKSEMPEKINVAYLIDRCGPGGGTENQVTELINNIDATQYRSHLFVLQPLEDNYAPTARCPVTYLNVTKLLSVRAFLSFWRFVRLLRREKIRIVQVYFVDSNLFGVIAARLAGIKAVIINRRDMGLWYGSRSGAWVNRINRWAHYCLVNAEAVKNIVSIREPFEPSRIEVIYNGVRPPKISEKPICRSDFSIPEEAVIVGLVSNLRPLKRIDLFLKIANQLKNNNLHFFILGGGPPELEEYKNKTESLQLGSQVTFHYTIEKVHEVMALFDIGVLTSETEGLSNVLVEYALLGIPAVAFDVGGNQEIISDGRTGFIIPEGHATMMNDKINYLAGNPDVARQMGITAREMAREKFNLNKMVSQVAKFYSRVLRK